MQDILKGSYDVAKNNIIWCIWCNAMCLRSSRFKKHIILHILYIIVAPLCSAFLKCICDEWGGAESRGNGARLVE